MLNKSIHNQKKQRWKIHYLYVTILLVVIYLLLPIKQSSIDGYGYACYIRDGEDLFLPHHLLYNAVGFVWSNLLKQFGVTNVVAAMKALNASLAGLSLLTLGKILSLNNFPKTKTMVWVLFVGSSWGVMRFATENETYILPIFLSLIATLFFSKHTKHSNTANIYMSGFFAALACLAHQIHFFWWLAILLTLAAKKDFWNATRYALPAIIVPITYWLAMNLYYNINIDISSALEFVLRDYILGSATVSFGLKYLMLSAISFARTFIQVHGYFVNLSYWHILGVLGFIGLLTIAILRINLIRFTKLPTNKWFTSAIILATMLQLAFAIASHGNAEFMVMLPFLLAIVLSEITKNETVFVGFVALAMLVWNISLGLIPLSKRYVDNSYFVAQKVMEMDRATFIVFNKPGVDNIVKYHQGIYPNNTFSGTKKSNVDSLKISIEQSVNNGKLVFTDCVDRPKTISRESITLSSNLEIFTQFNQQKNDSTKTLTGKYYIFKLMPTSSIPK